MQNRKDADDGGNLLGLPIGAMKEQARDCKLPNVNAEKPSKNDERHPDPFSELFSSSFNSTRPGKGGGKRPDCVCNGEAAATGIPDIFKDKVLVFGEEQQFLEDASKGRKLGTDASPIGSPGSVRQASCTSQGQIVNRQHSLYASNKYGPMGGFNCHQESNREDVICTPKSLGSESMLGAECFEQLGINGIYNSTEAGSAQATPERESGGLAIMKSLKSREDFDRFIDLFLQPSGAGSLGELQVGCPPVRNTNYNPWKVPRKTGPVVHAVKRGCAYITSGTQQSPQQGSLSPLDIAIAPKARSKEPSQTPGAWFSSGDMRWHPEQVFSGHSQSAPLSRRDYVLAGSSPFAGRISRTCAGRSPPFATQEDCFAHSLAIGERMPDSRMHSFGRTLSTSSLRVRIKLCRLSRMTEDQKAQVAKLTSDKDSLRFKFYRTVAKVAEVLGLPKQHFRQYNQLRALYNLFSRCGGIQKSSAEFLNSLRVPLSGRHYMYLSYILPLETCDTFYHAAPHSRKGRGTIVDRQDLVLCLSIGIYDDILFLFEEMEEERVCNDLASEILELFFLVSRVLLTRLGCEALPLRKLMSRSENKQYSHAIEKMPVRLLGDLQEVAFKALLKHKKVQRASIELGSDTVMTVVDALLARKSFALSPRESIRQPLRVSSPNATHSATDNGSFLFELPMHDTVNSWVLEFIIAANVTVDCSDAMMKVLEHAARHSPATVLQASRVVSMSKEKRRSLLFVLNGLVEDRLCQHLRTLESKVLLDDSRELEIIVSFYLPHMPVSDKLLSRIVCAVESYQEHLRTKKVYFHKKNSSSIDAVAEALSSMHTQSL